MKKHRFLSAAAVLLAGCVMACTAQGKETGDGDGLRIVTTIFPEHDWVRNVLGENPADAETVMLLDNGVDLHSYQPTAQDILTISECDLFIYVGGESDAWVEAALREGTNEDRVVINLLDVLGDAVKEEEMVEGMEEHDHDHDEDDVEYDEHVWLSLRNASVLTARISEALQELDPANADTYAANTEEYTARLQALDEAYQAVVDKASFDTLLYGDRFPFRYLHDDYDLDYYAAFSGCSAETEASFETILFLSQKVDELGLPAVMTIEGTDHRIAETIVQTTKTQDQQILTLNSMQSTTSRDMQDGASYLSIMEDNLAVLEEALA